MEHTTMENILVVTFHGKEVITKNINTRIGWNGIKYLANKMLDTCAWYFQYKDEEGDSIIGSTEAEWLGIITTSRKHKLLAVDIFLSDHEQCGLLSPGKHPYGGDTYSPGSLCKNLGDNSEEVKNYDPYEIIESTEQNDPCCGAKGVNNGSGGKCCSGEEVEQSNMSRCCNAEPICEKNRETGGSSCCSFQRPLPPDPVFDENEVLVKTVNPLLPQYKYANESLRAVACPLGPIGGGSIAIAGDGGLRQWQISNKVNHTAQVPDSFFAIKVGKVASVLQSNTWYDQSHFKPSAYITDHVVPAESKTLLSELPGVKTVEITAKYPVVEVDYKDDKFKDIVIHLEAWSPKIPHNTVDSAIPLIIFDYHITNNGTSPVEVSLLGSLQNIIGWDGYTPIKDEVKYDGYGSNTNSLYTTKSLYGINMSNTKLAKNEERYGHVAITAVTLPSDKPSTMLQYTKVKDLWAAFIRGECLPGQGIPSTSAPGTTFNGAVSNSRGVLAGQTTVFTYMMFWHIPNRYRDWNTFVSIPNTPLWVGTQYAKIWPTIEDVINYTQKKLQNLRTFTYKFRDSMFNTKLPWQLIDSAAGRVSVLNSPSCMWHHDGYFYAFEGCSAKGGCCPLNCTHVWNYEMTLSNLYPDLERTMREVDLLVQITPHGVMPSRTECPLQLERVWNRWKNYTTNPESTQICVDGEIGTVFKTYREIKFGAPKKWYLAMWDPIKLIMKHWLDVLDTEKNGLVYGPQPNTFDRTTYGYMVIFGLLYLCGLRAAEEMAKIMGDKDFEVICNKRFQLGTKNLDKECFTNGKWYTHVVDPNHNVQVLTDCTFVGALYGQWWAHLLGLGYLLPKDHIISHLQYTYKRNYISSFDPAIQYPRKYCDQRDAGWIMGQWDGNVPKNALLYSREASWSGVLYPFASLMIMEGMTKEGLDVLQTNRYLYDGTRRSPWNEIECGDHYTRPMSSWSLFQTASGQRWSILNDGSVKLTFSPTINKDNFSGFFVLGTCWGTYSQILEAGDHRSAKLSVDYGVVHIDSLTLHVPWSSVSVKRGSDTIPCMLSTIRSEGSLCIQFPVALQLQTGQILNIEMK